MCGICGVAATGSPAPERALLGRMCDSIRHRGPDDVGLLVRDGVGLGMTRLSIIDVEGGHQPIGNEDGSVWIVFNGEIYNHLGVRAELAALGHRFATRADTEAVVHAYEEWGDDCLSRLNGMFAFALWDSRRGRVLLARDRMGIKPLHYRLVAGRLSFASEIKALLEDPETSRDLDLAAVDEYLALEFVPAPRTILREVRKLPGGHLLVWRQSDGQAEVRRWWTPDLAPSEAAQPEASAAELAASLHTVLREAVRKEMISDVPLGVFLSGGIDSSAVAAMMCEASPGNVRSFSIGFADPSFDESRHARRVAQHLGTDHSELILEPSMLVDLVPAVTAALDEPLGDASIIPTHLLSKFTRESVKVALGGDGGDELFAGYPTMQAHRLAGYYEALPAALRRRVIPGLVDRLPVSVDNISFDFKLRRFVEGAGRPLHERHLAWTGSFTPEQRSQLLTARVSGHLSALDEPDTVADLAREAAGLADPLNRVLYLDMKLYLENDILAKVDRASMLASLEARVPLLNVDVVEHVTRLPLNLKLRRLTTKWLLKRALRDVLPAEILGRPKKGFGIPVARWLQGPLRGDLLEALDPARLRAEGLFRPEAVGRLVEEHLGGRRDHRKQLWTLFVFQRWLETYGAARGARTSGVAAV
jgi:asparagine synthase (glutamine-hydrolysing)